MLHKVMNGYTIMATEFSERQGMYVILGCRRFSDSRYQYVTALVGNVGLDTEWLWGNYINELSGAVEDFYKRV